ncbi:DUF4345 domain-containing protein [Sphingomonas sp. AX6]|uniref:DUF4345 domain-containing protein n=1 Tax=Sphingomonas sp. AX6 TaxID=2653171 RepID=UPI0012F45CD4|nr:DUF4345 domain-containing protein [Sphingomonas sp. AX6]VXC65272.1 conserved membrane hypothetical protein [Sphingomonas sp. AX6]
MTLSVERRLLQAVIAATCTVSLSASITSILDGPGWLMADGDVATDLDSHFRYLSGLLLAIAIGFLSCMRGIEQKGPRLRLLALIVVVGGLSRAYSAGVVGMPSFGHLGGLTIELVIVPIVTAWQWSFARRANREAAALL